MAEHIHRQRWGIYPSYSTELKKGVINQPNPSYRPWETIKSTSSCSFGQDLTIYGKESPGFHKEEQVLLHRNPGVKEKIIEKKKIKTKKRGRGRKGKKERKQASRSSLSSLSAIQMNCALSKTSPSLPVLVFLKTSNKQLNILHLLFPLWPRSLQNLPRSLASCCHGSF